MHIELWTDGACLRNPGPGGYAAILIAKDETDKVIKQREIVGGEVDTTNNRMEIMAVIEGLRALNRPTSVTVFSDSEYVVNTMTKNWKRKKNHDLWRQMDVLVAQHDVKFEHVLGHAGNSLNERCDKLAVKQRDHYSKLAAQKSRDAT